MVRTLQKKYAFYQKIMFRMKRAGSYCTFQYITRRWLRKNWKLWRETDEQKQTRSGLQHNGSFVAAPFWDRFPAAAAETSGRVSSGMHSLHLSSVQYAVGCHPAANTRRFCRVPDKKKPLIISRSICSG